MKKTILIVLIILFVTGIFTYIFYSKQNNYSSLVDRRIEINNNLNYLSNKNFKSNKITVNNVGIGDSLQKLNKDNNLNMNSDIWNNDWTEKINNVSYRINSNNKIVEINLSNEFIKPLAINREELIKIKFGKPDEIKIKFEDFKYYYYYDRGIIITYWAPAGTSLSEISINIISK
jgi:hypothetical protein